MGMFVLRSSVLLGRLHHFLMLFFAFFEYRWNALATFLREMPNESHNDPHFVVLEHTLPPGHAAEANAVFDDPLELSVLVLLNVPIAQVEHGRRHFAGEWNSGAVSVQTVANLAVMLEVLHPGLHHGWAIGGGILPIFTPDFH